MGLAQWMRGREGRSEPPVGAVDPVDAVDPVVSVAVSAVANTVVSLARRSAASVAITLTCGGPERLAHTVAARLRSGSAAGP